MKRTSFCVLLLLASPQVESRAYWTDQLAFARAIKTALEKLNLPVEELWVAENVAGWCSMRLQETQ